jgi:branched-chain amino acid transport system substrate-binding protein
VLVVGYPRDLAPTYGPGSQQFLADFKKAYGHEPILPQAMTAYAGLKVFFEIVKKAGSVSPDKVRATAASFEKPLSSMPTGWGVKFDATMQNTLATPIVVQWQNGKVATVFPAKAVPPGNTLQPLKP